MKREQEEGNNRIIAWLYSGARLKSKKRIRRLEENANVLIIRTTYIRIRRKQDSEAKIAQRLGFLIIWIATPFLTSKHDTPYWHFQPPKWLFPPPIT